ncbi:MAG: tRNA (adenosine(37)-N6)-threonylcarbamoyltransferase complex ATPase subunit type 1 TsaE [Candidatus Kaiserbacteria bacterium]|nr:tRNA (adenosine(37)-N6)-threonylcarbamoyltransferase complex ATPase subunit type 1 TsaE [Candidatus Kaiserbacteria bacterium]
MARTHNIKEFNAEAARFAATLKKGQAATIVALLGELGAGKTSFTQAIAKYFGIDETLASPTFVIEKIYEAKSGPFTRLIHIDAYRLEKARDLEVLGWDEIVADAQNVILLEWPEKVPGLVPKGAKTVSITLLEGETREFTYGEKN